MCAMRRSPLPDSATAGRGSRDGARGGRMKTSADYEARAQQADRLAAKAGTEAERKAIAEIAALWRRLAAERAKTLGKKD